MDTHLYYQYQVFRHQLSKLQAHKSSFQAWKCVSFGYALLATVLLSAKWHEVSTDLRLLNGIEQVLWQTSSAMNASDPSTSELPFRSVANRSLERDSDPLGGAQWGAATALVELLASNSSSGASASEPTNSSSAVLMSHMQISLGRELNGNQLLKQEVETFLAEFRSAKSTLSLSSLLVFVYIISWVLMTMAVNDTRISNDISLRNILLLSVFGAVDMAASIGFVMVRMIMFNVKSSSVVPEILGSASLRDAPIRLSSDQLTAFTALRLIAMRSCSAYVDVYVSVLVALLTVLRFYAIVRAIAYYRFLRRFNDLSRNMHHHHQLTTAIMSQTSEKHHLPFGHNQQQQQATTTLQGFVSQSGAGAELMRAPSNPWRPPRGQQHQKQHRDSGVPASSGLMLPSATDGQQQQQFSFNQEKQQVQHLEPRQLQLSSGGQSTLSAKPAASENQQQQQQQQPVSYTSQQKQISVNEASSLYDGGQQASLAEKHHLQLIEASATQPAANLIVRTDDQQATVTNKTLIRVASYGGQHHAIAGNQPGNQCAPLFVLSNDLHRTSYRQNHSLSEWQTPPSSLEEASRTIVGQHQGGAPSVLMVNGRPHKLVETTSRELARRKRHLGYESSAGAGFESEPVAIGAAEQRREYLEMRSRSRQRQGSCSREPQLLLTPSHAAARNELLLDANGNHLKTTGAKQPATFTLLSAGQLDRLSRKLLANATGSLALGSGHQTVGSSSASRERRQLLIERNQSLVADSAQSGGGGTNKYKLIARYRPVKRPAGEKDELESMTARSFELARQPRPLAALLDDSTSGATSSSGTPTATDSDEAPTARVATTPEGGPKLETLAPSRRRRELMRRLMRHPEAKASASRRQRARASLSSLRQTEELSLEPAATTNANRDLLLGKYYYA